MCIQIVKMKKDSCFGLLGVIIWQCLMQEIVLDLTDHELRVLTCNLKINTLMVRVDIYCILKVFFVIWCSFVILNKWKYKSFYLFFDKYEDNYEFAITVHDKILSQSKKYNLLISPAGPNCTQSKYISAPNLISHNAHTHTPIEGTRTKEEGWVGHHTSLALAYTFYTFRALCIWLDTNHD